MSRINVRNQIFTVQDFVTWMKAGSLELSPSFQRRDVWRPNDRSYFLDTVVRGMPTSAIYIREKRELGSLDSIREVVDGQQRIRTLIGYVESELLDDATNQPTVILSKHNDDPKICNRLFPDLSLDLQRAIVDYPLSTHVLPSTTDDAQILQIFARLNSSGARLTPQELRNAEFSGTFRILAYQLAAEQLERWRTWKIFTEPQIARMSDVELTSELMMMMTEGTIAKRQPTIDKYYRDHDDDYEVGAVAASRFRAVMDQIEDVLPALAETAFRQQAMFYSLFSLLYDFLYGIESEMRERRSPSHLPSKLIEASEIVVSGNIVAGTWSPRRAG